MNKKTLLKAFRDIAKETGFKQDVHEDVWMPKLKKGEYRSIVAQGKFNNRDATIKVSPCENYHAITNNFKMYSRLLSARAIPLPLAIKPPHIFLIGNIKGLSVMIQELPKNEKRLLSQYPSTIAEKNLVASVFLETRQALDYSMPIVKQDASEYFAQRLSVYAQQWKPEYIDAKTFISTLAFILKNASDIKLVQSFSHFTNNDIVKSGGQYLIIDATIVLRPEMYEPAFWLWGMTMHSYNTPPKEWLKEIKIWTNVFMEKSFYYITNPAAKLSVNLAERMLGILLVDLPLRRSPFEHFSDEIIAREAKLARLIIQRLCA